MPQIPEFVIDHVGNEVQPGDPIVYAVRIGNSGAMCYGIVDRFQFGKGYNGDILKIRIITGEDMITGKKNYSLIEESHKRFAKLPPHAPQF